jgi:hypothetical protein
MLLRLDKERHGEPVIPARACCSGWIRIKEIRKKKKKEKKNKKKGAKYLGPDLIVGG